ncbi:MAG: tetratricopeptide repeat protein, partial [Actinocatenispora sp.]
PHAGRPASGAGARDEPPGGGEEAHDPVVVQCQLPADIVDFTGRRPELRTLRDLMEQPPDQAPTICVLHGMGGVGKTRLAVHAAHRQLRAGRYQDGQLYVDLRGVTAQQHPAHPADVLESFLRQLGVPGAQIPGDIEARAAMFRDRLADRHMLLLLDNAGAESQVLPLLPAGQRCTVLITSRRNLSLDGAVSLPVDVFPEADALEFLAVNAGSGRVAAEPDAAAEVVRLCGYLPIAVTLAAHRLRARPAWRVTDLLGRLRDQSLILGELVAGSRAVQDVIELSYHALTPDQRRLFRLLGDHPGVDATAASAGAAADLSPHTAAALLESLLDEHLLLQTMPDRYRMHDLVRSYAHHLVDRQETGAERLAALRRLLRYYVRTATQARSALDPHLHPVFEPSDGQDEAPSPFGGRDEALRWFHAERVNLVAVVHAGARHGEHRLTWQLSATLLSFFYLSKHWDDWLATHRAALTAAARAGDVAGQARIRNGLGVAYDDLGRFEEAIEQHVAATELFRQTPDRRGEAWNLNNLGVVHDNLHRFPEAEDCYRAAGALFRELGDPKGEAICLNNLGDVHRQRGRFDDAERCLRDALDAQRGCDDREGQRITFGTFGDLYRDTGRTDRAAHAYRLAVEICVEFDDRWRATQLRKQLASLTAGNVGNRLDPAS